METNTNNLSVQEKCPELWNEYSVKVDNNIYIITTVLNIMLCVPTFLINMIMFIAVWRTSALRMPSNILISALAVTNFFVGIASQPIFAINNLSMFVLHSVKCVTLYLNGIFANLFCSLSLLIFTAISVDQYLMIRLHLRYNTLVTNKKTTFSLAALLLFSGIFTALSFLNKAAYVILLMIINCTCFIIAFISYTKIYRTVIRHQQEIHDQTMAVATRGETNKVLELARFKKRTFNIMCIYIVFLSSNIPFLCTAVLLWMQTEREVLILGVKNFAVTIIFFNSLVNPLLICWKMRDIRNAMKRLVCFMCRKYDWDRKLISFLSNFLSNVSILGVSALIQLFHFIPFQLFFQHLKWLSQTLCFQWTTGLVFWQRSNRVYTNETFSTYGYNFNSISKIQTNHCYFNSLIV